MRPVSKIVLGAVVGACVVACSPACNTPEAKPPEAEQERGPDAEPPEGSSPGVAKKAVAIAEHEKKRAELPKGDMIMEAPGVDTSKLSEAQRGVFFQVINTEPSACNKPHSMARSLQEDPDCRDSMLVAQFVADALASGAPASAVKHDVPLVVDALQPKEIDVTGRPIYGAERAPVTVVVFADFQCPHCRAEAPVLRKAIDQFRGRARLVYKHFPLPGHPQAKDAAIATEAAHEQGKFWEMHDLVFENQTDLSDAKLYEFAAKIGLDQAKFKASYSAKKGKAVVEKDREEGEALGIGGTPAVYVNGREVIPALFGGNVTAWIDDALKR
ncbi:MAG: DsbA family protein [Myxococcales bacterium]|nr:DsbA family protein [Myxococcales bacterium]